MTRVVRSGRERDDQWYVAMVMREELERPGEGFQKEATAPARAKRPWRCRPAVREAAR